MSYPTHESTPPIRRAENRCQPTLTALTIKLLAIASQPDGKLLAVGGQSADIYLLNPADGALVHTFKGHSSAITVCSARRFDNAGSRVQRCIHRALLVFEGQDREDLEC
jgi:hypothetical protein